MEFKDKEIICPKCFRSLGYIKFDQQLFVAGNIEIFSRTTCFCICGKYRFTFYPSDIDDIDEQETVEQAIARRKMLLSLNKNVNRKTYDNE